MKERHIVTIDLGSSKFALAVAKQEADDIQVIYYDEMPASGMSRGAVFNETTAAEAVRALKEKAENELGLSITHAAVNLPRYEVKEISCQSSMELDPDKAITLENVRDLMEEAKQNCVIEDPDKYVVYDAVSQSFSDGEVFQIRESEIVGLEREHIEGNFKIFVGRKSGQKRIDSVFSKTGITPFFFFPAQGTARAVLSDSEMETGVALVEIGAGVSSVTIYTDGILRCYGSIPFGGKVITSDIKQECSIGEHLAENIKKGYGMCMPGKLLNLSEKKLQIRNKSTGADKQIPVRKLSEIIDDRMGEIVDAVLYLIQESCLYDEIRNGIVLTGGCAELGNIANKFNDMSGLATKIGYPISRFGYTSGCAGIHDPAAAATTGLLIEAIRTTRISYATPGSQRKTYTSPWERAEQRAGAGQQERTAEESGATLEESGTRNEGNTGAQTADGNSKGENGRNKGKGVEPVKPKRKHSIFDKIGTLFSEEDEV